MQADDRSSRRTGLARALSKLGYCSRSRAAELVRSGKVQLNGTVRRNPEFPVVLGRDRIELSGSRLESAGKRYIMLNKPRGVITTASDEKGRKTVYGLLGTETHWVAPVGRLDKASEGLLLLTNDSEWASRITDPRGHVPKTYHVQIGTVADSQLINTMLHGFRVGTDWLQMKEVRLLRHGKRNSWLEVVLEEGKNRHIRRMFEHVEVEVLRLVRVAVGALTLGDLPKGKSRNLTAAEKQQVDAYLNDQPGNKSTRRN
ncbi:MAG TPA: pseudouridine synthase [Terriglobales bacterium]|nr:pseudouridine synthase [Terriglobales bacterium]